MTDGKKIILSRRLVENLYAKNALMQYRATEQRFTEKNVAYRCHFVDNFRLGLSSRSRDVYSGLVKLHDEAFKVVFLIYISLYTS